MYSYGNFCFDFKVLIKTDEDKTDIATTTARDKSAAAAAPGTRRSWSNRKRSREAEQPTVIASSTSKSPSHHTESRGGGGGGVVDGESSCVKLNPESQGMPLIKIENQETISKRQKTEPGISSDTATRE